MLFCFALAPIADNYQLCKCKLFLKTKAFELFLSADNRLLVY